MFRNLRFFRLESAWPETEAAVSVALANAEFQPCGPMTERSSGWMPVYPEAGELLARRLNGADLVRLRSQSRVLPAAVIKEALEERIEAYRNRMQQAPSPRETRRLKAETHDELLPKAMLKSDRVWGYIDLKESVVGIDTAQPSVAERFHRRLNAAFDDLKMRPLQYSKPVDELLTRILLGDAPDQFAAGRECRMQEASDAASNVRWTNFDLSDASIRRHVVDGMRLTHLAIVYDNVLGCVLDEHGTISKLQLLGMNDDSFDDSDPTARLDAEFALVTGTLRMLLADLRKLLGGLA